MKVTVIASTVATYRAMEQAGFYPQYSPRPFMADGDADDLAEFAGRACYQSWSKPNPETATPEGYHRNTLDHGHYSIYEHASITFYVEDVSRNLTHELIRHRHLSFSQLSQRFVAEDKRGASVVEPPAVRESPNRQAILTAFREAEKACQEAYRLAVHCLEAEGKTRKEAREAARAILPGGTDTKIVVTGNIRAWREFIQKRDDPHADKEIRSLAKAVLATLREIAPHSVQDLED